MLNRFIKHGKWRNIVAIEKLEVRLSVVLSVAMVGFLLTLDIFNNFVTFKDALQSMVSGFIGGFIALLGFSLSAVALVASLFSKKDIPKLEQSSPGGIESMLANFEYLGFVTSVSIIVLCIAYITMEVEWPFHVAFFYVGAFIVVYLILFTMFYTVSLVSNCVKLYTVKLGED